MEMPAIIIGFGALLITSADKPNTINIQSTNTKIQSMRLYNSQYKYESSKNLEDDYIRNFISEYQFLLIKDPDYLQFTSELFLSDGRYNVWAGGRSGLQYNGVWSVKYHSICVELSDINFINVATSTSSIIIIWQYHIYFQKARNFIYYLNALSD